MHKFQEVRCPVLMTSVMLGVVPTTPVADQARPAGRTVPTREVPVGGRLEPETAAEVNAARVVTVPDPLGNAVIRLRASATIPVVETTA